MAGLPDGRGRARDHGVPPQGQFGGPGAGCRADGLSIKTIRHYDEVGLVAPSARSAGGFRLYTADDIDRLLAIRRMKPLGVTLDEMRTLLESLAVLKAPALLEAPASTTTRPRRPGRTWPSATRGRRRRAKLRRQLDHAHELTAQLAEYAPD